MSYTLNPRTGEIRTPILTIKDATDRDTGQITFDDAHGLYITSARGLLAGGETDITIAPTAGGVIIASAVIRCASAPAAANDLTNKAYVDQQILGRDEFEELTDTTFSNIAVGQIAIVSGSADGGAWYNKSISGDATMDNAAVLTIASGSVQYYKMQNVSATDMILGRSTAGAGVVEEITCTNAARQLLAGDDKTAQKVTLDLGNVENTALSTWAGSTNLVTLGPIPVLELGSGATGGEVRLADTNVAHGVTDFAETDQYGVVKGHSTTKGGLEVIGLSDSTQVTSLKLLAINGSDGDDTIPSVHIQAAKRDGTGLQNLDSDHLVLQVSNNGTPLVTVDGEGDSEIAGALEVQGTAGVNITMGDLQLAGRLEQQDAAKLNIIKGDLACGAFMGDEAQAGSTLYVDTSEDKVGIGTKTPSAPLSFSANANEDKIHFGASDIGVAQKDGTDMVLFSDATGEILFARGGRTGNVKMAVDFDAGGVSIGHNVHSGTPPTSGLYVEGNVGIGTSTPTQKLEVKGDATYIQVTAADGNIGVRLGTDASGDGALQIRDETDDQVIRLAAEANSNSWINTGGNVGIGTDSPTVALDVSGDSIRVRTKKTPVDGVTVGVIGQICWDESFMYICTADGTDDWKKVALAAL